MAKVVIGIDLSGKSWKSVVVSRGFNEKARIECYADFPPLSFEPDLLFADDREEEDISEAVAERAENLFEALSPYLDGSADVVIGLGQDQVSLRILDLPFSQPVKIARVLPFEAESSLPFDSEDMLFDFYPLHHGENITKVFSAAIHRDRLSALLAVLKQMKLDPVIIAPTGLCFHHLTGVMPSVPAEASSRIMFLDLREPAPRVSVTEGSRTIFASALGSALDFGESTGDGDAEPAAPDTDRVVAALLPGIERAIHFLESFSTGDAGPPPPVGRIVLLGEGANLPGIEQALSSALDLPISRFELPDQLLSLEAKVPSELYPKMAPALSLALQKASPNGPGLNFRKEEFAFRPERKALMKRSVLPGILLLVLMVVIGIRVSLSGTSERQKSDSIKKEMERIFRANFANVPVVDPSRQLGQILEEAKAKQQKYQDLAQPTPLECLAEISKAIPDSISAQLSSFDYRNDRLSIVGTTDKLEDPNEIAKRLKLVSLFKKVELESADKTNNEQIRFKISVDLRKDAGP